MPPDRLTATPTTTAVLRVLAGVPLDAVAADTGVDPADLADAVDTYQAAGTAALQQHADGCWYQVRVEFTDWNTAEHLVAAHLGPQLDAIGGWWFLRKHPCWRLRFVAPDVAAVNDVLDELVTDGAATRWRPSIYEPETAAFGGPTGMRAVHDLFVGDSRGVLDYLRRPSPALGRRELSLLLLGAFLHAADLDWFERGDTFAKVAQMRPTADTDEHRIAALADDVRGLLAVAPDADNTLFGPEGAAPFAAPWHAAHITAGRQLATAATAGTLHRGLRAVASHIVIFHWNRLGLPATTQSILARAAHEAFLPRS
ncbi:thiopeptide-type bacteriocin biosynthesis protein [Dactylosporangium sp. NPDC049525]|uniref:thiopeptide-type bacteriocin biosynthesis protein n=1 Tax=Dactylosporangium sp. NPDC049525 TaxID=3154730 RepID=UPI00341871D2